MPAIDTRATMLVLPRPFQPFLTWLTGKALPGEQPLVRSTPTSKLAAAVLALCVGVAGSILAIRTGPAAWLALPFCWMVTAGAARNLHVHICHQCVHVRLYGRRQIDRAIGEILSALVLVQDYRGFQHDHAKVHHGKQLATLEDADVNFLLQLGFRPGDDRRLLWRRMARTIVSPRFHALYFFYRLKANFWTCPGYRKALAVGLQGGVLALVLASGNLATYLVAWLFPLTVVMQVSALLQFSCEHRWLRVRQPGESAQIHLARITVGRFLGQPAPPPGLTPVRAVAAWLVWTAKMITYHLICRTYVLIGDLPVHDFHHRHPQSLEWPNAIYARQRDIDAGCPNWQEPYEEVWGLRNAIGEVFELWSRLEAPDVAITPAANVEEVLRSM